MKISLIITTYNEAENILSLLESIVRQSLLPSEVIIVDSASRDGTQSIIKNFAKKHPQLPIKLLSKKCTRGEGRNLAMKSARYPWIATTDAGCILDHNWLVELVKLAKNNYDIIAGYYVGVAENNFEKAQIPYFLVMKDKIDKNDFLPATRSLMMKKAVFEKHGGFDESLRSSEDFEYFSRLKKHFSTLKWSFTDKAIVYWRPKKTWKELIKTIYEFAREDTISRNVRGKMYLILLRYLLGLLIVLLAIKSYLSWWWIVLLIISYLVWSIRKNYRYVGGGWYYLPSLQVVSDAAVIIGYLFGKTVAIFFT